MSTRPTHGLYCPAVEDHTGPHLLLAMNDENLFLRCRKHDWMRVELYRHGQKISLKDIAVVVEAMPVKPGKKGHYFDLTPLPLVAKGTFPVRNTKFRWEGKPQ